jgi:glucuronosyltransferase
MMSCQDPSPLPKDLQSFLDSSGEQGAILVSFGSVLKASEMSESMRKVFLNVFSKLKQKVLWKFEDVSILGDDKPENVMISPWFPQMDLLSHKNLKLFVMHGGQSSFQEALCHKTPVVSIGPTLIFKHAERKDTVNAIICCSLFGMRTIASDKNFVRTVCYPYFG